MYPSAAASSSDSASAPAPAEITNRLELLKQHTAALDKLRADFIGSKNASCLLSDHTLLGYWRAVLNEHPKAAEPELLQHALDKLQATSDWRVYLQIDTCMEDPAWRQAELEHRRLLFYDFMGNDSAGRPVLVERCGAWDIPAVVEFAETDPRRFESLHCMCCELMKKLPRPPGCPDPYGHMVIMDLDGLSMRHLVSYSRSLAKAFIKLARVDGAHFPDSLAHIFIVNAGVSFAALAALVRPFLPEQTLSKLHVSRGVPSVLAQSVAPSVLPRELGGVRDHVFPYDVEAPPSGTSLTDGEWLW